MLVELLTACLGSLGFSLLFHIRGPKLFWTALGSMLTWGVYLLGCNLPSLLVRAICAAGFAALYSEICARLLKSPATIFLIPSAVPLIPGGSLYYTMSSALQGDAFGLYENAMNTWKIALGISIGVAAVSTVFRLITSIHRNTDR